MPGNSNSDSTPTPSARSGTVALLIGSAAFAGLTLAAGVQPGPRSWGLHAAGFLPPALRWGLFALYLASLTLLVAATLAGGKERRPGRARPERDSSRVRGLGPWPWLLLLPYAGVLWLLRARTQLLGDGAVWLVTVQTGERRAYSEPLSAALWHGFGNLLRVLGSKPDAGTMALFSVLCGVFAAALLALIAKEIAPKRTSRIVPLALLLTLGVSQLYFGYIESYPAASLFILLYLWLALRHARGAVSPFLSGTALSLAAAAHMSALYLAPSYLFLVATSGKTIGRKLAELAVPVILLPGLLLALGYPPSHWVGPFRAATSGMREGFERLTLNRGYGFLSLAHASDVANAIFLALPVPALLIIAWIAAARGRLRALPRPLAFLAIAAIPGFALAVFLMTPVAPAQDWDLASILLVTTAIFGVAAGAGLLAAQPDRRVAAGLAGIALSSLFSFVLVNARESSAVERFRTVINDPERVSRYGRAYGNSILEQHFRDRGLFAAALPYARATLAAEPTNPRHWTNVGNELMALGRIDEAIPYLEEAVRRGPDRWEGNYNLGLCYVMKERYADAVPVLRDAVRLEGNQPMLRHNLGLALYRSGRADSAIVVWKEILERWPDYAASLRLPSP